MSAAGCCQYARSMAAVMFLLFFFFFVFFFFFFFSFFFFLFLFFKFFFFFFFFLFFFFFFFFFSFFFFLFFSFFLCFFYFVFFFFFFFVFFFFCFFFWDAGQGHPASIEVRPTMSLQRGTVETGAAGVLVTGESRVQQAGSRRDHSPTVHLYQRPVQNYVIRVSANVGGSP